MSDIKIYRVDEPRDADSAASYLPAAYRQGHPWPMYVNGIRWEGFTVLLFPAPDGDVTEAYAAHGHTSGAEVFKDTGLDPMKVRTWAIHDNQYVTDVTGLDPELILREHDYRLPMDCHLPFEPTPAERMGDALVATTQEQENEVLRADLALLAECLLAEAERREWCSEYDDFVAEFNARSASAKLTPCTRNRAFTVEVTTSTVRSLLLTVPSMNGEVVDMPRLHEQALRAVDQGQGRIQSTSMDVTEVRPY